MCPYIILSTIQGNTCSTKWLEKANTYKSFENCYWYCKGADKKFTICNAQGYFGVCKLRFDVVYIVLPGSVSVELDS